MVDESRDSLPSGYRYHTDHDEQLRQTELFKKMGDFCRIDDEVLEEWRRSGFDPRKVAEEILRQRR